MGWRGVLTVCLLLAALLTGWSAWRQREAAAVRSQPLVERSDYLVHDFNLVVLNSEGQEAFSVEAPRLWQTIGARTLELTTPLFLIPDRDHRERPRWRLTANSGWVSADGAEIRLHGDVFAAPMAEDARPLRVETEALTVFPQQELATSDVLVTITRPGTTMTGTGMRAQLNANRIELLSKVHFRNEPISR